MAEIFVDMFKLGRAASPDILFSGGLGPCVAIAVYNPHIKTGYMMHEPNLGIRRNSLKEFISAIKRETTNMLELKVCATGSSPFYDGEGLLIDCKESRRIAEDTIRKEFQKKNVRIEWTPQNFSSALSLYTETGKFEITRFPES